MAVLQGERFLNSGNFNFIVETLASRLARSRPLTYIDRLREVQAFDDEMIGRFTGTIIAADIIADDQEAVVQESGKVEIFTNAIPNLKIGQRVGQAKINVLQRMKEGRTNVQEENALESWENTMAENLIYGVRQRMNAIACAMMIDAWTYDRLGIKITGSWGMPAVFKVTPTVPWSTAATATPIDDIFAMDQVNFDGQGVTFNRVTMSSKAFRYMVATTSFAAQASIPLQAGFQAGATALPTKNQTYMAEVTNRLLSKELVIDDATYTERTNEGKKITKRYLPENKVLLDRKENDQDTRVWDWANGIVTESVVADLTGGVEGLGGPAYGPVGYYTGRQDLNPPDLTAWGVARGIARRHEETASAVLTVF